MTHLHRFYVPPETVGDSEIALPVDEAHHALHVVRVRVGDPVGLFDGCGCEVRGVVVRTTRHEVYVAPEETRRHAAPRTRLFLLQAYLNRERSVEDLIRRGTELGVTAFRFFSGEHSERAPRLNDKWRRTAIETCKQCGRAWLPEFEAVADLRAALDGPFDALLVATSEAPPVPLRQALDRKPNAVGLLVGPEGGFSTGELDLARKHGAVPVSLGPATYRSETAASLAAALILYELGELGAR
jgi:16S rRNA (uracil1498-N3)-methyltransferase